jgi:hypothetical protein
VNSQASSILLRVSVAKPTPWRELLRWEELPPPLGQKYEITGTVRARDIYAEHNGELHRWRIERQVYHRGTWLVVRTVEVTDEATVVLADRLVDGQSAQQVQLGLITCQEDVAALHASGLDWIYIDKIDWDSLKKRNG